MTDPRKVLADPDAEAAVLSAMLMSGSALAEAAGILDAEAFTTTPNALAFSALLALRQRDVEPDPVALAAVLREQGELAHAGGHERIADLMDAVPTAANVAYHARIVRELAERRRLLALADELSSAAADRSVDLSETGRSVVERLLPTVAGADTSKGFQRADYWRVMEAIEARGNGTTTALLTGLPELDDVIHGFQPGELVIVGGVAKGGKAQPLTSRVRTVDGWTTIGELRVGDAVASVDGAPSEVAGIFPQGERQIWRVHFSDGAAVECCGEHLWHVGFHRWAEPKVLTTEALAATLEKPSHRGRLTVPMVSGDFGHDDPLPLSPYLLGALLGDGGLTSGVMFSKADERVLENVRAELPQGCSLNHSMCGDYRIVGTDRINKVREALFAMGLMGCGSHEKFIPQEYLNACRRAREELLRGLLDTDGYTEGNGKVKYCTTSARLAADVTELVQSLGGLTRVVRKKSAYRNGGVRIEARDAYVMTIKQDARILPLLRLERHLRNLPRATRRSPSRTVVRVERTENHVPMACIMVSHPSHLYVTDGYVVTHNTTLALTMARHAMLERGASVAFVSAEMTRSQLLERLLNAEAGVPVGRTSSGKLWPDDYPRMARAAGVLASAKLYIDDAALPSLEDIDARALALVAKEGPVDLAVVDFLQLVQKIMKGRSTADELSAVSYGLKGLGKRLGCPVIAPCQLNYKDVGRRANAHPTFEDLAGSSGMMQAADFVILTHRPAMYDPCAGDDIELTVRGRRIPDFTATLRWEGQYMRVVSPLRSPRPDWQQQASNDNAA